MRNVILSHKNCIDGFVSAMIMQDFYSATAPPQVILGGSSDDRHVLAEQLGSGDTLVIVDYSVAPEDLVALCGRFIRVVLLDHHKTTLDLYQGFQAPANCTVELDLNFCGAGLALRWYRRTYPDHAPGLEGLVEYVQDYDLWHHHHRDTDAIILGLHSWLAAHETGNPSHNMAKLMLRLHDSADTPHEQTLLAELRESGRAIQHYRNGLIAEVMPDVVIRTFVGLEDPEGNPVRYAVVNSAHCANELSQAILKQYPGLAFVAVWRYKAQQHITRVSLRNLGGPDAFNCAALAAEHGGGGHQGAAGFNLPGCQEPEFHVRRWYSATGSSQADFLSADNQRVFRQVDEVAKLAPDQRDVWFTDQMLVTGHMNRDLEFRLIKLWEAGQICRALGKSALEVFGICNPVIAPTAPKDTK